MVLVVVAEAMIVVAVAGVETMVVVEVDPSLNNINGLSFPLSNLSDHSHLSQTVAVGISMAAMGHSTMSISDNRCSPSTNRHTRS